MKQTNVLLCLQALLVFAQGANLAIEGLAPRWKVLILAGIGAVQFLVQHIGNQTTPGK